MADPLKLDSHLHGKMRGEMCDLKPKLCPETPRKASFLVQWRGTCMRLACGRTPRSHIPLAAQAQVGE